MDPKIEALEYKRGNSFVFENDVQVNFEYEKLVNHQVKFFMTAYVGKNQTNYRFCLKLIYIIDMIHEHMDDNDIAKEAIKSIIPSFTQLIILLDPIEYEDNEKRH